MDTSTDSHHHPNDPSNQPPLKSSKSSLDHKQHDCHPKFDHQIGTVPAVPPSTIATTNEMTSDLTHEEISWLNDHATLSTSDSTKLLKVNQTHLLEKLWNKLKKATDNQRTLIEVITQQTVAFQEYVTNEDRRYIELELGRVQQFREQENQRKELEALKRNHELMKSVVLRLSEPLKCPICTEVAILPKVLGTCGHIACQNCLKQMDDVTFSGTNVAGASARQLLLARRCPLCRVEIVGQAFPVMPLKDVAEILISSGYVQMNEQAAVQKHIESKTIVYEKESAESRHIVALQLGCYAQSQLAQHSVTGVLTKVTPEQWVNGVYVLFEAATSRVFFETFATTLHGKAGGLNVLVNASQRMLAVQLIDKSKPRDEKKDEKKGHVLIKVGTDGRFIITTTPVTSPPGTTAADHTPGTTTPGTVATETTAPPTTSTAGTTVSGTTTARSTTTPGGRDPVQ